MAEDSPKQIPFLPCEWLATAREEDRDFCRAGSSLEGSTIDALRSTAGAYYVAQLPKIASILPEIEEPVSALALSLNDGATAGKLLDLDQHIVRKVEKLGVVNEVHLCQLWK